MTKPDPIRQPAPMKITSIKNATVHHVAHAVRHEFTDSRFTLQIVEHPRKIDLYTVRLVERKEYCGNHPCACEIGNPRHRKARFLEGADWVEFNDRLNDTLDRLGVEARIESAACVIRRGRERRTVYSENQNKPLLGNYEWLRVEDEDGWGDFIGQQAPRAKFPDGTPGIYEAAGYECVG